MFHSLSRSVVGSDLSYAMLRQAQKKLKEAGLDFPLKRADFRELDKHFKRQFDAVVCLTNSINEVLEESEVLRALRSMKAVLRPGGILVFDQGQSDAMMKNPPRFDPIINNRDFSRLFVLNYSTNVMQVNIFDFGSEKGLSERKCHFTPMGKYTILSVVVPSNFGFPLFFNFSTDSLAAVPAVITSSISIILVFSYKGVPTKDPPSP